MNSKSKSTALACIAAVAVLGTSCGKKETVVISNPGPDSGIPAAFIAPEAPGGALSVVEARAAAKPGAEIVLRGKVGGKKNAISDKAAILVLADEKAITSCDHIPEDECPTPWDYCCDEPDTVAASIATIQVKDADGKLLRTTLRGAGDLKELSHLVIAGTVDEASTPEALIVNARKIHVEKP